MTELNPKTEKREFGGVPGSLGITFGLPLLLIIFGFTCNSKGCPVSWTSIEPYKDQWESTELITLPAIYAYAAWFSGLALLDIIVPGKHVKGTLLRNGQVLDYKFNGKSVMVILGTILVSRGILNNWKLPELDFAYDNMIQLTAVTIVFSFIFSTLLYLYSLRKPQPLLALGANTGNIIYDWFLGHELNPRIGCFDLKLFCEMRPGLLLWVVINLSMVHHQYWTYGRVTDSIILVSVFQSYYVIEGTFYEEGLISMIDVVTDGFGFMLVFGDLALVPFSYSLPTRYLADHPIELGLVKSGLIVALFLTGLLIFRLSNNQKAKFKIGDPSVAHLKYIQTPTGSKLITSGWWGVARHINYLGDWIIAWCYSLPTGFNTPITYFYVVFFGALLIHREIRDEEKCSQKYGETWKEYKKQVPYRIIPGIY